MVNPARNSNAQNRLNRLTITKRHKVILFALSFAYFFEFADVNTFAVTAPKLIQVWGISVNTIAYITSITFLGMFLGSIVGGWITDKLGRKKGLSSTVIFFSIFSLLTSISWDPISLGFFRFLTAMGLAAMTIAANTYISEIFPAKSKGKFQALAIMVGICGTPATSWIARFIIPLSDNSWRLIFIWGALGIVFLFFSRKIVESPSWYESRGKYEEANKVLQLLENEAEKESGPLPQPEPAKLKVKVQPIKTTDLFKGKLLKSTLLLSVLWITQTIGFFGFSSWAPTLLFKEGIDIEKSLTYVSLALLGAPLGSFIAALVTDRFERKWLLSITGFTIALCGLFYGLTFQPIFIVVFGILLNVFERTYTSLAYSYSPELFPVEARAVGTGFPYGVGRLSNMIGPILIGFLYTGYGYQVVFYFIAGTWAVGAITLALFGPKTKFSVPLLDDRISGSDPHPAKV
ncbi:MFS transporter [Neobacillus vireti]|uniref:Major facilitator superfamily protein n=1 Tax=Neobacillus vireti LMG 21834 TaxID=1131730 RepID=A0AB94ISD4_9BACI|nr:MFS transporter [Neobacillus vireti]ETI69952.1 major facilitator superfamily protein [Neobacillus vireti LMG 21834]KLT18017.1 major facilitator transporter [Neobacillus vireti]